MKKIVFFFLMTILIASCHQEELSSVPDEPEGKQPVFDLSEEEVLQGLHLCEIERRTSRRGAGKEHRQHGNDRSQGIGSGCFFFENRENGTYFPLCWQV